MPGMHGWVHVNRAIQQCDVLLNIGGRFDDRVTGKASTFAPHAKIIHVDIDPSEIGKNVQGRRAASSATRAAVLQALLEELPGTTRPRRHAQRWIEHIRELQRQAPAAAGSTVDRPGYAAR